jgi:hypothetical protein
MKEKGAPNMSQTVQPGMFKVSEQVPVDAF